MRHLFYLFAGFFCLCFPLSAVAADSDKLGIVRVGQAQSSVDLNSDLNLFIIEFIESSIEAAKINSFAERYTFLDRLFSQNVDYAWITKFAIGQPYIKANHEQRVEMEEYYKSILLRTYAPIIDKYSDVNYRISNIEQINPKAFIVKTENYAMDRSINVHYKVRKRQDGFSIYDFIIDNVSFAIAQKADFESIRSLSPEMVIDVLRQKANNI